MKNRVCVNATWRKLAAFVAAVVVLLLFTTPSSVLAQGYCRNTGTMYCNGTMCAGSLVITNTTMFPSLMINTMRSSAICAPMGGLGPGLATYSLLATRTAAPNAYCQWTVATSFNSNLFTCRFDTSKGLPVELMEFSIERSDQKAPEAE